MLAHVRFLKDAQGIEAHMQKHAELLRPRFDLGAISRPVRLRRTKFKGLRGIANLKARAMPQI